MPRTVSSALTLVLAVATFSFGAAAQHQICFYADNSGAVGHGFVQLLPTAGPQAGQMDLVFGKYPASYDLFGGPGVIKWDKGRRWDKRICFDVTTSQYNGAAQKISSKQGSPPPYHLVSNPPGNCVDWMTAVATAAGLGPGALPNKFWFGIADPETFHDSLCAFPNGGVTPSGGVVTTINPNPTFGADGVTPIAASTPRSFGGRVLAITATTSPSSAGSATGLPVSTTPLGGFTTDTTAGVAVQATNTAAAQALISVNWGDGSDVEANATTFAHLYTTEATFQGAVAVIDSGNVRHYPFQVDVVNGGPISNNIVAFVPTPTPAGGTNPGFENPPIAATIPTIGGAVPAMTTTTWSILVGMLLLFGWLFHRR
ncbi:MAG: hypothetical protein KDB80_17850 [Planctomycetes bacterium]|nr:hypothetical protein [Planctomycetota bacterium]